MNKTIELTELELAIVKCMFYESFKHCDNIAESVQQSANKWKVDAPIVLATIADEPDSV